MFLFLWSDLKNDFPILLHFFGLVELVLVFQVFDLVVEFFELFGEWINDGIKLILFSDFVEIE